MSQKIEIGDTEVEIRETDDGFEAVEVEEEVHRTAIGGGVHKAMSAGESVYTDGKEVWLGYKGDRHMSADADDLLRMMETVESEYKNVKTMRGDSIVVASRFGNNPVLLFGYDQQEGKMYRQNTNAEAVREAVEAARE